MKWFLSALILPAVLAAGCAHSPYAATPGAPPAASLLYEGGAVVSDTEQLSVQSSELWVQSREESPNDLETGNQEKTVALSPSPESSQSIDNPATASVTGNEDLEVLDYVEEEGEQERAGIADPLEPFNRAMYHFNDKLYFWVLKPLAQGYRTVVPEQVRIGVRNLFANSTFPIRFVNCLLQANFPGAASELGRFVINTLWGIGGLLDIASHPDIHLSKYDEDFGQTLGIYGVGQGFFINWPILGPSNPRDTLGLIGDIFLYPSTYLVPWDIWLGIRAYEMVNDTSLSIGDYESLKEAAIDPYVAIRDAYVQYRQKKVKDKGGQSEPSVRGIQSNLK